MGLKGIIESLDSVEEQYRGLYKQREDGKYVLDVEDLVEKAKLDEFRSNNRELKAKNEELAKQVEGLKGTEEKIRKLTKQLDAYKGIEPEKYKETMEKLRALEEQRLRDEGKIEELMAQRTEQLKADYLEQLKSKDEAIKTHEEALKKIQQDRDVALRERDEYIIVSELAKAIDDPQLGLQSGVSDLLRPQVLREFTVRDGKVLSTQVGENGQPRTLRDFLSEVVKDKPFLVRASNGSGATPHTPPVGEGGSIVLTEQQARDPQAYRRAKDEAAKKGATLQTA